MLKVLLARLLYSQRSSRARFAAHWARRRATITTDTASHAYQGATMSMIRLLVGSVHVGNMRVSTPHITMSQTRVPIAQRPSGSLPLLSSMIRRSCMTDGDVTRADLPDSFPGDARAFTVQGTFKASKGRQTTAEANHVQVLLLIVRLPNVSSDLVITMNTPIHINELSATAQDIQPGDKMQHLGASDLFRRMIAALEITDWTLFG